VAGAMAQEVVEFFVTAFVIQLTVTLAVEEEDQVAWRGLIIFVVQVIMVIV
jgi:hypothetical protein